LSCGERGCGFAATDKRALTDMLGSKMKIFERRVCRVLCPHQSTQRRFPCGRADEVLLIADMIELAR